MYIETSMLFLPSISDSCWPRSIYLTSGGKQKTYKVIKTELEPGIGNDRLENGSYITLFVPH